MKNKEYTIGEIFRLGLLKNHKGEPYSNQGTISKVLRLKNVPFEKRRTVFGWAKFFSERDLDKINRKIQTT